MTAALFAQHTGLHRAPRKPRPQVSRSLKGRLRKTVAALTEGLRAAATPSLLHDEVFWGRPVNGRSLGTLPRQQVTGAPPWPVVTTSSVETSDWPALPARTAEEKAETERSWRVFNASPQLEVEPGLAKRVMA